MVARGRILIADADADQRSLLSDLLRALGFSTTLAASGFKALDKLPSFSPDVLLAEHHMPGLGGIELMRKARALRPGTQFVATSRTANVEEAVRVMREGAFDYLVKPIDPEKLERSMRAAVNRARVEQQALGLRDPFVRDAAFQHIVAEHPSMLDLLALIRQIAPSRASVLLEGESGTGKGIIAQAIHRASLRVDQPFVRLSCAELTPTLLESEVFGHEKGAYTGAFARRDGRFKQADRGTLFLDEVSEIPLGTQVKLLRFMQERCFEPVGGNDTIHVDVRVISASNRSLQEVVDDGRFRLDLFYRLNVVPLRVPPLRERCSDIPLLAGHFLEKFARDNQRNVEHLSDESIAKLLEYPWPGNVRELENVIERAVVLCEGRTIEPRHLPPHLVPNPASGEPPAVPGATVSQLERWAIMRTLEAVGGSTSRAAAILGISSRKIQYKLREYERVDAADNDVRIGRVEREEL